MKIYLNYCASIYRFYVRFKDTKSDAMTFWVTTIFLTFNFETIYSLIHYFFLYNKPMYQNSLYLFLGIAILFNFLIVHRSNEYKEIIPPKKFGAKVLVYMIISIILAITTINWQRSQYLKRKINSSVTSTNIEKKEIRLLNFFGDSLINHFPKYSASNYDVLDIDTFGSQNTFSLFLTKLNAKKEIDSLLSYKLSNYYNSDDSSIVIVNDFLRMPNSEDSTRVNKTTFIEGISKYPIPNFYGNDLETNETRSRLPKDFSYHIINSKIGIYSKKIKIEKSSMPQSMLHGYSRGYAISEKRAIIIYWVIIW